MNRSINTQAIILSLKPLGDNNYTVTALTKNKGIIYATLYGGPKSKLKSLVSQWNSGILYLYDNQEKKQIKINDFDVKNFHSSFSENLYKAFAANLIAEIIIKTKCAGSYEECFNLTQGFIDGMEICNENQSKLGLIRFLWRYINLLGIQPETQICEKCDNSLISKSNNHESVKDEILFYNSLENYFLCKECGQEILNTYQKKNFGLYQIKKLGINYLDCVKNLSYSEVRKLQIDKETYEQIKNIIFFLIENNIDSKLNTLETGIGIL